MNTDLNPKCWEPQNMLYSSSLFICKNHRIAIPNMKNEDSSIHRAPHPMTSACFRIEGIAKLPTTEAPVKNLVKFTQLFPSPDMREEESDPPKNNRGIGRSTYITTVSIGHQLLYKAHAKTCNTIPPETKIAKRASPPLCRQATKYRGMPAMN